MNDAKPEGPMESKPHEPQHVGGDARAGDEVPIDRHIGDDPAELWNVADEVVHRKVITNAEIKSLRKLIEAVEAHPDARLAPPRDQRPADWKPPPAGAPEPLTCLQIEGGVIRYGDCQALDVRLTLRCSARFEGHARFDGASFAGKARFDGASFAGKARFDGASFAGEAWFGASFAGSASFVRASFAGNASFHGASFAGKARFNEASFTGAAQFAWASFAGEASFYEVSFAGEALFNEASFTGAAQFTKASFAGKASFPGARFAEEVSFYEVSFAGAAWFAGARFAREASFYGASFAGRVDGDFRCAELPTARFGEEAQEYIKGRAGKAKGAESPSLDRTLGRRARIPRLKSWVSPPASRQFGWKTVRGLGQLSILTRVSLIALIAVPVIAAFWPAVRAAAGAYHRYVGESHAAMDRVLLETRKVATDGTIPLPAEIQSRLESAVKQMEKASDRWHDQVDQIVKESPHMGMTLVFTFFAAVAVTFGLLLYQVRAPEEVPKFDEDAFIDRAHRRYPEEATDRNDGLRRAIENLERIAERRPDRHKSFVKHHGDTIWVPPREMIEWFDDLMEEPKAPVASPGKAGAPEGEPSAAVNAAGPPVLSGQTGSNVVPVSGTIGPRSGQVPGAERRRIVIEEGARAEYWLKSRENLRSAGFSFALYLIGIVCLLIGLCIQMWRVVQAAGWFLPEAAAT